MAGPNDAVGPIQLISTPDETRKYSAFDASFSPDGAKVLFRAVTSGATSQLPLGADDIVIKDLTTGVETLVSTAADGTRANNFSFGARFSPDGTKVAFLSMADNLVSGDTNGVADVFVKDLATGAVTRISTDSNGAQQNADLGRYVGGAASVNIFNSISWSPDSHRIAFSSTASNLVSGDTNADFDVFIKDLTSGATTRVTKADGSQISDVLNPVFSPDGAKIAFSSYSTSLATRDIDNASDLFVQDLQTGAITWVSTPSNGARLSPGPLNNFGVGPLVFSPDGTKIAFTASFALTPEDDNQKVDVFVEDLTTGVITRVSTAADGAQATGPGESSTNTSVSNPVFSPDGTMIAFYSRATNLVPGDTNESNRPGGDVFIKDLLTGEVTRVSTAADGGQSNADSFSSSGDLGLAFSPDGSQIVFESTAGNLVPSQGNAAVSGSNIFVKTLLRPPASGADSYRASYSEPLKIDAAHGVLANDQDRNRDTLTVTSFSDAKHGRVDLSPDGSFIYTPDGTFVGVDSFTYQASDAYKTGADTTVTIKVLGNIERADTQADGSQAYYGVYPQTPVLSPDGKYVALVTHSSDLAPNPYSAASQVVLKNLATGALTIVSGPPGGDMPVFSPDGTKIAFSWWAQPVAATR